MASFDDIIGREPLKKQVTAILQKNRIGNACILEGPSGTGKKMIADAIANLLFCNNPDNLRVCNKCDGCTRFQEKYVLNKDTAISVDDIRAIVSDTALAPFGNKRKVYIIANSDTMTEQAQNAFLKTLEDSPLYAYFILTTTDSGLLAETIRSRCIRIYTGVNTINEVTQYLYEKYPDEKKEKIIAAAGFSQGGIGVAEKLLSDKEFEKSRAYAKSLLAENKFIALQKAEYNVSYITDMLHSILRDAIVYKHTQDGDNLINSDISDIIIRTANNNDSRTLHRIFDAAAATVECVADNVPKNIAFGYLEAEMAEELRK